MSGSNSALRSFWKSIFPRKKGGGSSTQVDRSMLEDEIDQMPHDQSARLGEGSRTHTDRTLLEDQMDQRPHDRSGRSGMNKFDNIMKIYEELSRCTSSQEIELLKKKMEGGCNKEPDVTVKERDLFQYADHLLLRLEYLTGDARELVARGEFLQGLTLDAPEEAAVKIPISENMVGANFESNMNEILAELAKPEFSVIGVLGMGGVGKTALVKHIHNTLLDQNLKKSSFMDQQGDNQNNPTLAPRHRGDVRTAPSHSHKQKDIHSRLSPFHPQERKKIQRNFTWVYWVNVSRDCSIHKLQDKIAERMGVTLPSRAPDSVRAGLLKQGLESKHKFTFILDDVWDYYDLIEVGIPSRDGCNLILTSRLQEVCRPMHCQRIINVEPLSEEDAWRLFDKTLGITLKCDLLPIAKLVAKECAGLPLGIITLAKSMPAGLSTSLVSEWRTVLAYLQKSKVPATLDMMEERLFKVLRWSYDHLKDPKIQQCLLCCALYPESSEMKREDLIWTFFDEGLLDKTMSIEANIDEGHMILNILGRKCLLENDGLHDVDHCLKIHDLIRDMLLQIAATEFMVRTNVKFVPDEEEWTNDLEKVSLVESYISEIPDMSPTCPKLSTLWLQNNQFLRSIPDNFCKHFRELKVLNLSFTQVEDLPNSIFDLTTLTALLLRECKSLRVLPSLAKLKALKRLDLYLTGITEVPESLETLFRLRYLNLDVRELSTFPAEILRKLFRLEYLVVAWKSIGKLSRLEFNNLKRSKRLELRLHDMNDFNEYAKLVEENEVYCKYQIQMGSSWIPTAYYDKCVRLCSNISGGDFVLPKDAQSFSIEQCLDITSLCDIPSLKNATHLKSCRMAQCSGMKYFLSSPSTLPLQRLEKLDLYSLENLHCLVGREIPAVPSASLGTFSQLKEFYVQSCPKIKKLFPPSMMENLRNLERLTVYDCKQLEYLIASPFDEIVEEHGEEEEGVSTTITEYTLPKLKNLVLRGLLELKNLCSSGGVIVCNSLEAIHLNNCQKLRRVPVSLPLLNEEIPDEVSSLKTIYLREDEREWWETVEWCHGNHDAKHILQPFCRFSAVYTRLNTGQYRTGFLP